MPGGAGFLPSKGCSGDGYIECHLSIKSLSARADLSSLYHRYRAVLPGNISDNMRGCGPNVVLVGLYL